MSKHITKKSWELPRRTFLRGLGTAISLPMLDVMMPSVLRAQVAAEPTRAFVIVTPTGLYLNQSEWVPSTTGANYSLTDNLMGLAAYKQDFNVLSNLYNYHGDSNGDGGGDHARAQASYLTGSHVNKTLDQNYVDQHTGNRNIEVGISFDQVIASGMTTKLRSLEMNINPPRTGTNDCDTGYACINHNYSWSTPSTPVPSENNPRLIFDRLFSGGTGSQIDQQQAKRDRYQKSILDFVLNDATALQAKLGQSDKLKLDEYLTNVRELERRINLEDTGPQCTPGNQPSGIPGSYQAHIEILVDLAVMAFKCDVTRMVVLSLGNEAGAGNRVFTELGHSAGWHTISHYNDNRDFPNQYREINKWVTDRFAYVMQKMKSTPTATGNLLDHSMVTFGSGINNGQQHGDYDLPLLLAGKANGAITPGRHIRYSAQPIANLWLKMINVMGGRGSIFGDATQPLNIT